MSNLIEVMARGICSGGYPDFVERGDAELSLNALCKELGCTIETLEMVAKGKAYIIPIFRDDGLGITDMMMLRKKKIINISI